MNGLQAYNAFLQTGRVEDYLKYVDQMRNNASNHGIGAGDGSAFYNGWDRPTGTDG